MKKFGILIAVIAVTVATSAMALDLKTARAQGILVEQPTGFVVVAKPSAEANALAEQVNKARKAEYERISKENGQTIDVVAKLAAEQIKKNNP